MADRFADTFFGSYLMGGRPEFGMSPFAPTHPAQSPAEDIKTKAALLRGVLPFAPGGGIMELPETQRQYQTAKQQFGEGNYGQAIVPGLLAGLGGLDATAEAAMAAAGIWPHVLVGALGAKFLAKSGKAALKAATEGQPALKAADLDPSGFYSPTRRAIEGLQDTGTGNQFAGQLGGVAKVKEMEDSGVTALLASRGPNRVTKEELLEQHDRGRPQFREKWKSEARADEAANWTEEDFGWALREAEARGDQAEVQRLQETWDGLRRAGSDLRPRWGRHVIPGGENYQELLLTLPEPQPQPFPRQAELDNLTAQKSALRAAGDRVGHGQLQGGIWGDLMREKTAWDRSANYEASRQPRFTGGHDREPNVLIRVRMDDRVGADGRKHLFLQEFQSDWHLEGRDRGYRTGPQFSGELSAKEMPEGAGWEIRDENNVFVTNVLSTQARSRDEAIAAARRRIDNPEIGKIATDYRVPDAPLKGVWSDTAMRRMIRYASENNYDSISWTPGRMQQDRYDLSKHVDRVIYNNEMGDLHVYGKDDSLIYSKKTALKDIDDVVGKDLGDKIRLEIENDPTSSPRLEGVDLKMGGEWAENLYDKQLVNAANKWAKKRGGKVRKGTIERSPTPEDATRSMETWTLDITPEMKTGALLEGMPMYGLAGAGILTAAAARGIGETEREAY